MTSIIPTLYFGVGLQVYQTLTDDYTKMFTQQWMVSGDQEGGWLAFARCSVRNGAHFPRTMQDFDPINQDDHWCALPALPCLLSTVRARLLARCTPPPLQAALFDTGTDWCVIITLCRS